MNDTERSQWVDNDEGLYNMQRRSGLSKREFVRQNRELIDEVSGNVRNGKKPAHYLEYHHGSGCRCYSCRNRAEAFSDHLM